MAWTEGPFPANQKEVPLVLPGHVTGDVVVSVVGELADPVSRAVLLHATASSLRVPEADVALALLEADAVVSDIKPGVNADGTADEGSYLVRREVVDGLSLAEGEVIEVVP